MNDYIKIRIYLNIIKIIIIIAIATIISIIGCRASRTIEINYKNTRKIENRCIYLNTPKKTEYANDKKKTKVLDM